MNVVTKVLAQVSEHGRDADELPVIIVARECIDLIYNQMNFLIIQN